MPSPKQPQPEAAPKARASTPKKRQRLSIITPVPEASAPTNEDNASIRAVKNKIEELFNAIGTDTLPETLFPSGPRNNGPQAAEYAMADLLQKLSKIRHDAAKDAAQAAGVFGDEEMYIPNETVTTWQSPDFAIHMKLGRPSKMINKDATTVAAEKFLGKKAPEFLAECMKDRAATKQIIVSMK